MNGRMRRRRTEETVVDEAEASPRIGMPPVNRQQAIVKMMWIGIWMAYLGAPVSDLADGHHSAVATVFGTIGLVCFVAGYFTMVFRHSTRALTARVAYGALAAVAALALTLTLTLGVPWLVLYVYVAVAAGAVLPITTARYVIPLVTALLVLTGLSLGDTDGLLPALLIPALLGGFAMSAVRQIVRTTVALREARATVAHLAANEERLRLARDLHDLLGHSLSLITLKSELAGRMLPGSPEQAAQQVADIERVSRQALVDVREAVSGFRRPTLQAELAGARAALTDAGIAADVGRTVTHHPDLPPDAEGALAWALREAVTNVVRHSGAKRCVITLAEEREELCLTVTDDGRGAEGPPGNGLNGLAERLQLGGGRLETEPGARHGYVLRAYVPRASPAVHPTPG